MRLRKTYIIFLMATLLTACATQRIPVGNYDSTKGKPTLYKEGKDIYLFWNTVPMHRTDKHLRVKDYEKVVKRSVFDNVVFYGTAGIFSFYTVKIMVIEPSEEKGQPQGQEGSEGAAASE